jgi:hypothetical protein
MEKIRDIIWEEKTKKRLIGRLEGTRKKVFEIEDVGLDELILTTTLVDKYNSIHCITLSGAKGTAKKLLEDEAKKAKKRFNDLVMSI